MNLLEKGCQSLNEVGLYRNGGDDMGMAIIVFDADKSHNEKVLACEGALVKGFKEMHILTSIGDWDEADGKGIDDLLAAGKGISYHIC